MPSAKNGAAKRNWVSLVPYGLNQQHPNAYKDILDTLWENRDNLGYAWRILSDGCCDGCSLGTSGMHDWTMKGIHLCAVRLQLLRLNTMPAMDCASAGGCRYLYADKTEETAAQAGTPARADDAPQGRQRLPPRLLGRSHRHAWRGGLARTSIPSASPGT